jgi:outer membrane protein, heavy metal efflux system
MATRRRVLPWFLLVTGAMALSSSTAQAQGPTIDTSDSNSPGGGKSPFGRTPGAGGAGPAPPADSILGGRLGPGAAKGIPTSISNPGMTAASLFSQQGVARTVDIPAANIPAAGPLSMPPTEEDPGPADGMTLDQAIDLLIKNNLDLSSKFYEIPQAKADILTASLRANPVFYADAQLVPYGQYSRDRPGGQTQYDVNISYPLDLSHKRQARTASAVRATKVTEAQYQDAVRQSIDNLYSGYVDLLQARRTIAFSKAALEGLTRALAATEDLFRRGIKKQTDVQRIRISLRQSQQQLLESQEAYRKAKQALATQLNIAPEQADAIEPRGTIKYPSVTLPPIQELIGIALNNRPDVISYRLGLARAKSDVKLQYANRFQDVYVLYQPYTLQDNTPFGLKSPTSWALGVTIPLPIYNRNQGNIQRAKLNVGQTQAELASVERQAIQDVQVAEREYITAKASAERNENEILPDSTALLREAERLFPGEIDVLDYLAALKDYNDNARTLLDSQVRLRRAMLNINTVVGQRVLP